MPLLSAGLLVLLAANPYLDDGRRLLKSLDYERAEKQLELALQVPTSTLDEKREAYHLLVRAKAARGHLEDGERLYTTMLAADPHAPPPEDAAPKIRDAFRRAKESLYPPGHVELRQLPLGAGQLDVQLVDPWDAVQSLAVLEASGDAAFVERALALENRHAHLELKALQPGESLRFYVEARGSDGHVLATLGSPAQPLQFQAPSLPQPALAALKVEAAPPEPAPPKHKLWAVPIGLTAAAAVALGTASAFGFSSRTASDAAAATEWNDSKRALDATAQRRATWANITFGGAAVLAIAAALAWVW